MRLIPHSTRKECTTHKIKIKLLNMAKNIVVSLIKNFRELSSLSFVCFFVTLCNKTSIPRTHSNSTSLLNDSLLVKLYLSLFSVKLEAYSKQLYLILITYTIIFQGPWPQVLINNFAEHLLEFVSMIIDMYLWSQWALNHKNRRPRV